MCSLEPNTRDQVCWDLAPCSLAWFSPRLGVLWKWAPRNEQLLSNGLDDPARKGLASSLHLDLAEIGCWAAGLAPARGEQKFQGNHTQNVPC